jgi:hypothetical protein
MEIHKFFLRHHLESDSIRDGPLTKKFTIFQTFTQFENRPRTLESINTISNQKCHEIATVISTCYFEANLSLYEPHI